jgi:hypothetical protein
VSNRPIRTSSRSQKPASHSIDSFSQAPTLPPSGRSLVRALTRLRSRVPGPFRAGRQKLTRSTFQLQIGGSHRVPSQLRAPDRPEAGPSALVQRPRATEYFRPHSTGRRPALTRREVCHLVQHRSPVGYSDRLSASRRRTSPQCGRPPYWVQRHHTAGYSGRFDASPEERARPAGPSSTRGSTPRRHRIFPAALDGAKTRPHKAGSLSSGSTPRPRRIFRPPQRVQTENQSAVRTSSVPGSTTQVRRIFPATPAPRPPGGLHLTGEGVLRGVQRHQVTGYFRPPAAPEETSRTALGVRGGPRCPRGSTAQDRRIFPAAPPAADDGCVPKKSQRGAPGRCTVTASPPPGTASACTRPP